MKHSSNFSSVTTLRWLGAATLAAGALTAAWRLGRRPAEQHAQHLHRTLIDLLLNALSAGDTHTAEHSRRVADLAFMLGGRLGLDEAQRATLRVAALLHDMGKIDDQFFDILHSREALDDGQLQKIKAHPHESAHILAPLEGMHPGIMRIVSSHHECWDGSGYPNHLRGEQIPLEARIITVADVFDALTQQRSYRDPLSVAEAFAHLRQGAGSKFDPRVVALLQEPGLRARWTEVVARGRSQAAAPPDDGGAASGRTAGRSAAR